MKLDDPWLLDLDNQHHNMNSSLLHFPFIAALSERFATIQCSCGTNWGVRLEVA